MSPFKTRARIVLSLLSIQACVLFAAMSFGFFADDQTHLQKRRAQLCETLAICGSNYVSRYRGEMLGEIFDDVVMRNKELLSVGVRGEDGSLITNTREHAKFWGDHTGQISTASHVTVPFQFEAFDDVAEGRMEFVFYSPPVDGFTHFIEDSSTQLVIFLLGGSFLGLWFFVGRLVEKSTARPPATGKLGDRKFVSILLHEIRSSMNTILGFNNLLASSETSEQDRITYTRHIQNGGKHLLRLVNAIHDPSEDPVSETPNQSTEQILNSSPLDASSNKSEKTLPKERTPRLAGLRVLIVDDGDSNRQLMKLVLERAGATVKTAIHGKEAVEMQTENEFDAILMDMQMPVMDGQTATRILRDRGCTMPIIALTANALKGDSEDCINAGCTSYFPKPINIPALVDHLADIPYSESNIVPIRDSAMSGDEQSQASSQSQLKQETPDPIQHGTPEQLANPTNHSVESSRNAVEKSSLPPKTNRAKTLRRENAPRRLNELGEGILQAWRQTDFESLDRLSMDMVSFADEYEFSNLSSVALEIVVATTAGNQDQIPELLKRMSVEAKQTLARLTGTANSPAPPSKISSTDPIAAAIPENDPELAQIADEFLTSMVGRIEELEELIVDRKFEKVASIAHRLKGTAGTVGFPCLTEPARQLEKSAKLRNIVMAEHRLQQIRDLTQRMQVQLPVS